MPGEAAVEPAAIKDGQAAVERIVLRQGQRFESRAEAPGHDLSADERDVIEPEPGASSPHHGSRSA